MEMNVFKEIIKKIGMNMDKKAIMAENKYELKDVNSILKLLDRITNDLKDLGINNDMDVVAMQIYSSFSRSNSSNVKEITFPLSTGYSFARKETIDQRINKLRNLEYLYNAKFYAQDKRSIAKAERDIRILEKEIDSLQKNYNLFKDSSDFKLMANKILSNDPSNKKPSYIENMKIKSFIEEIDFYDEEGKSYLMDVTLLNKKDLSLYKKDKSDNCYIEKYQDNYFLIKYRESYSTPKEFELSIEKTLIINFDKIPQFKNIFKERDKSKDLEIKDGKFMTPDGIDVAEIYTKKINENPKMSDYYKMMSIGSNVADLKKLAKDGFDSVPDLVLSIDYQNGSFYDVKQSENFGTGKSGWIKEWKEALKNEMIAHKDDDKEYQSQYLDSSQFTKKYNEIDLTANKNTKKDDNKEVLTKDELMLLYLLGNSDKEKKEIEDYHSLVEKLKKQEEQNKIDKASLQS